MRDGVDVGMTGEIVGTKYTFTILGADEEASNAILTLPPRPQRMEMVRPLDAPAHMKLSPAPIEDEVLQAVHRGNKVVVHKASYLAQHRADAGPAKGDGGGHR
jgi:hypothetical protein